MADSATSRLARSALNGDRAALARLISLIENDACDLKAVLSLIHSRPAAALTIGVTGPPGAGKSTFVAAVLRRFLDKGLRVAVVAVDPSSPITRGAVLGDRVRMAGSRPDPRLYIRSLAARGHLGGLSGRTALVADLLDAAGYDVVIIETVGVGQSEVAIASLAAVTLLVLAPGFGDDVQGIKSGILEVADLFVVNKSDLPEADTLVRHLRSAAPPAGRAEPLPVMKCSAAHGVGIEEITATIHRLAGGNGTARKAARDQRLMALLRGIALERFQMRLRSVEAESRNALVALLDGPLSINDCADRFIGLAAGHPSRLPDPATANRRASIGNPDSPHRAS